MLTKKRVQEFIDMPNSVYFAEIKKLDQNDRNQVERRVKWEIVLGRLRIALMRMYIVLMRLVTFDREW
jgi:hypothetical protein